MIAPALGTLNTVTPCAACKLLRRRCSHHCPFAPYFAPTEPFRFAVVHKIFGASNVTKMLMKVEENQRADAANSLVYEANVRMRDPVHGCMGAISSMQQQLQILQGELHLVRSEIFKCRYKEAKDHRIHTTFIPPSRFAFLASSAALPPPLSPPSLTSSATAPTSQDYASSYWT